MASYTTSQPPTPISNFSFHHSHIPTGPRAQRNRNSSTLLRHVLTRGCHPAATGSQASQGSSISSSAAASKFGEFKIKGAANLNFSTYNPSEGPAYSNACTQPTRKRRRTSYSQSYNGSGSQQEVDNRPVCVLGKYQRSDFRQGDIISLPFHTPNLNPNVVREDLCLTQTKYGPAYSKRRMFVVLFMHRNDMFCLPLYSFGGMGLMGKSQSVKYEYVCMKNEGDKQYFNQGNYPPVEAKCHKALTDSTTVHLTGGKQVSPNEDIFFVGRMPYESFQRLRGLWHDLTQRAQDEEWRD